MSNRKKPKILNRTSGQRQRPRQFWSTGYAHPANVQQVIDDRLERNKPRFILQPKGGVSAIVDEVNDIPEELLAEAEAHVRIPATGNTDEEPPSD